MEIIGKSWAMGPHGPCFRLGTCVAGSDVALKAAKVALAVWELSQRAGWGWLDGGRWILVELSGSWLIYHVFFFQSRASMGSEMFTATVYAMIGDHQKRGCIPGMEKGKLNMENEL